MATQNQCQFWDCNESIPGHHFLCYDHYIQHGAGMIDECKSCGRYKDVDYDVCLNCYRQTASAWAPSRSNTSNERTGANRCRFWDCNESIPSGHFLCGEHYFGYQVAAIDKCQPCGQYKFADYDVCRDCYQQPVVSGSTQYRVATQPRNGESSGYFVYILTLDGGEYYIGQTNDLHARLQEHRINRHGRTAGRNPKLVWYTTVPTRAEAKSLEEELQRMNANGQTRRKVHQMVVRFRQLVDELDYTPHQSHTQTTIQERRLPYGGVTPSSRRPLSQRSRPNPMTDVDDLPF